VTRIVAGAARGRRLAVPPGTGTRPTSDRAREALFSSLEAAVGSLAGARVADLYAGSGAVGLEALSRGALHCLLVEADAAALRTLRRNVATVGLPGADVEPGRVERVVAAAPPGAAYDVVFLDPPYDVTDADLRGVVGALGAHGWLAPGAVVVVERATRGGSWTWPDGIEGLRSRRYGEATLWYGRAADPAGPADPVETAGE
jgi:16S rRNA (guanine966-N2)-methyltransferase